MTQSIRLTILLFVSVCATAYGQKVKYKDVFALLNTKQYEVAEPFLKQYLKDNTDNPNAYLFMAMVYQDKAEKSDLLKQTQIQLALLDSALLFYDKAYKSLTEKEIKRNSEYYQAYSRRDLRTGEYGVKLSDVQVDIEKRVEVLRNKVDLVKITEQAFSKASALYNRANDDYRSLQERYKTTNKLLLRANDGLVSELTTLGIQYDSSIFYFKKYKDNLPLVGKTGYQQELVIKNIEQLSDGGKEVDFFTDEVHLWNYKKFADQTIQTINNEIVPLRQSLVAYDSELNKLRNKLNQDSLSVNQDLAKIIDKMMMNQLQKFDNDPLPLDVFALKTSDLTYRSSKIEHKRMIDTLNVHHMLSDAQKELSQIQQLDSITKKILTTNLEKRVEDYQDYIKDAYGSTVVLKTYVQSLQQFSQQEILKAEKQLARRKLALNWILLDKDSVPVEISNPTNKYKPLLVLPEKYTVGLAYKDTANADAYFYTITPTRKPDIRVTFPIDKPNFRLSRLPESKAITYADPTDQLFFVLVYNTHPTKDGKYPVTLSKIYRSDGLAWSQNFLLTFIPTELVFMSDNGSTIIKGETQQWIVDKAGKVVR
jgi:hypothetical protein